jgi:hypothetical protein
MATVEHLRNHCLLSGRPFCSVHHVLRVDDSADISLSGPHIDLLDEVLTLAGDEAESFVCTMHLVICDIRKNRNVTNAGQQRLENFLNTSNITDLQNVVAEAVYNSLREMNRAKRWGKYFLEALARHSHDPSVRRQLRATNDSIEQTASVRVGCCACVGRAQAATGSGSNTGDNKPVMDKIDKPMMDKIKIEAIAHDSKSSSLIIQDLCDLSGDTVLLW